MGDRGQVYVHEGDEPGVYLYTHWGASHLTNTVKGALAKHWRWEDGEYLARIIFEEMIAGSEHTETGYGIGTQLHGDVWKVVDVDCATQHVKVMHGNEEIFSNTFSKFVEFGEIVP